MDVTTLETDCNVLAKGAMLFRLEKGMWPVLGAEYSVANLNASTGEPIQSYPLDLYNAIREAAPFFITPIKIAHFSKGFDYEQTLPTLLGGDENIAENIKESALKNYVKSINGNLNEYALIIQAGHPLEGKVVHLSGIQDRYGNQVFGIDILLSGSGSDEDYSLPPSEEPPVEEPPAEEPPVEEPPAEEPPVEEPPVEEPPVEEPPVEEPLVAVLAESPYVFVSSYSTITKYTGTETIVTVPDFFEIEGVLYPVTTIGKTAFKGTSITEIYLPDSVQVLGKQAFHNTPLTKVTIGDNVVFEHQVVIPGKFYEAYVVGGAGTYVLTPNTNIWVKQ